MIIKNGKDSGFKLHRNQDICGTFSIYTDNIFINTITAAEIRLYK